MSNEFARPAVTLVDIDGNPVCVQLENGKYFLHVQDQQTMQILCEIRELLSAILAKLSKD